MNHSRPLGEVRGLFVDPTGRPGDVGVFSQTRLLGYFAQESKLGKACFRSTEYFVAGRVPALYCLERLPGAPR